MNVLTKWLDRRQDRREAKRVKPISMLSIDTLAAIRRLAIQCGGPVIEVGTYVGGTSILISRALSETQNGRLISVEGGGDHPTHPTMPSRDIIGDWRKNISEAQLSVEPTLIEGFTWRPSTIDAIGAALGPDKARMIVIDSDGFPGITLVDIDHLLADACILVADDYAGKHEKADTTHAQIECLTRSGSLEQTCVLPYGTWFGRRRTAPRRYRLGLIYSSRQGAAVMERVPSLAYIESWNFSENGEQPMARASVEAVIAGAPDSYSLIGGPDGAAVYFTPRNPDEMTGRRFELYCGA